MELIPQIFKYVKENKLAEDGFYPCNITCFDKGDYFYCTFNEAEFTPIGADGTLHYRVEGGLKDGLIDKYFLCETVLNLSDDSYSTYDLRYLSGERFTFSSADGTLEYTDVDGSVIKKKVEVRQVTYDDYEDDNNKFDINKHISSFCNDRQCLVEFINSCENE